MSCVAEPKATASAHQMMGFRVVSGSLSAMPTSPPMIISCDSSSQLRLRPSARVSSGSGMRSTSGDHIHLKA